MEKIASIQQRYQQIRKALFDKGTPILMAFIVFVTKELNYFITPLQTNKAMIHLPFQKCMTLIQTLLQKIVKKENFINTKTKKLISSNDLQELDVVSPQIRKVWVFI